MFSLLLLAALLLVSVTKVNSLDWKDAGSVRMAKNCDWDGRDTEELIVTNGNDCLREFVERSDCTSFTWTTTDNSPGAVGNCWLKYGDNSDLNVLPKYDEMAICGYKIDTNGKAVTSANKPQVPVPTAAVVQGSTPQFEQQSAAPIPAQSVSQKNPWLMWVLIGLGLIGIFGFCFCLRPHLIAKRNKMKIGDKEQKETKVESEGNKQPYQPDVATISAGPPKPV